MDIGANIKSIRKSKGITQKTLADNTKISYRTLQDYENNKIKEPAVSKLIIIANELNVTLGELTGETEILKNELILRDTIAYGKTLKSDIEKKQESLRLIENAIEREKDPEILKTLFHNFNERKSTLTLYKVAHSQMESKIKNSCELLGITKEDFMEQNPTDEEKEATSYLSMIQVFNNNINYLMKNEYRNKNKILDQIMAGKLECYKELFTIDELKFMTNALRFLAIIKKYVDEEGFLLGYTHDSFVNEIVNFYSIEKIGLDPKMIELNLNEIMDKK